MKPIKRPLTPALVPGDHVAVIAPAGNLVDYDRYRTGCSIIRDMGFVLAEERPPWPGNDYLADTDGGRAAEFNRVWTDPRVKAIIALRGGYGCARLLEHLDFALLARQPKILVGFSDISLLLNTIFLRTGLICLHGPMVTTLPLSNHASRDRLYQCLIGNWHRSLEEDIEVVRGGPDATGPLLGGNLTSLASIMGTPWAPDCSGAVLFLEDVNEPPYRLDRSLTQLAQCGVLGRTAGIILGEFTDDRDQDPLARERRHEFVWTRVSELTRDEGIPIWGNFPVGHGRRNLTLPIGATAVMDSSRCRLHLSGRRREQPYGH